MSRRTGAEEHVSQDNNRQTRAARRPWPSEPSTDLLRRMRGQGAMPVAQGVQTTKQTSRRSGTELEQHIIATQGAHLALSPERRCFATIRREPVPCRLQTVPVKSCVIAPATAQNVFSSASKSKISTLHVTGSTDAWVSQQSRGSELTAAGNVRPLPHWTTTSKSRVTLKKAPGSNGECVCGGRCAEVTRRCLQVAHKMCAAPLDQGPLFRTGI